MMTPLYTPDVFVYYRTLNERDEEAKLEKIAIDKNFNLVDCMTHPRLLEQKSPFWIFGRYSVLPFYKEVEKSLSQLGGNLINTYKQHRFAADLFQWYPVLKDFTPKTYFNLHEIPEHGPFVLKGETNSKKFLWNTHMFAENKAEAIQVAQRLFEDGLISNQQIVVREYVQLNQLDTAPRGLPICEEYRFFFLHDKVVSGGFYWSSYSEITVDNPKIHHHNVPQAFLQKIGELVSPHINFYVVDVARTENGEWIVIELNDAQMSGLSENDPNTLWRNLKKVMHDNTPPERIYY